MRSPIDHRDGLEPRRRPPASNVASAPYAKLKPGRGHSPEEVAADQRARLQRALVELADERGFESVTVAELARRAGVSTRTFYERFDGKQDCLLATYEYFMRSTARKIAAAHAGGAGDWRERLRRDLAVFARAVAEEPQTARLAFVEVTGTGLAALDRIAAAYERFEAMIAEAFAAAEDGIVLPAPVVRGIVGGLARVARQRLLTGRERELPQLVDPLLEWALALRSGAAAEVLDLGAPPTSTAETELTLSGGGPGDERGLILSAAAELAGKEGYAMLTVPAIRRAAGVSRRSFDAHFQDVQDCFLEVLRELNEQVITIARAEGAGPGRDWGAGVHRAFATLCAHAARQPALARLVFIEVYGPGPAALRHRVHLLGVIAERFRAGAPPEQRPSPLAAEASMGAAWSIVHHEVAAGRTRGLPRLAPTLSFVALAPAVGAQPAVEVIRTEQARTKKRWLAT